MLRLHKPKNDKKVQWDEAVIDNEHMGKKKSKCEGTEPVVMHVFTYNVYVVSCSAYYSLCYHCVILSSILYIGCCIYEKPRRDSGSDSDSDSDGDNDCCHEHRVARARVPRQQHS